MITLKEALALTQLMEDDAVYIRKEGSSKGQAFPCGELTHRFDPDKTMVTAITPRFNKEYEFLCLCFETKEQ